MKRFLRILLIVVRCFNLIQVKMFLITFLLVASPVLCLDNGVALTPPMGWMTWQRYRCNVDCKNYPNDCLSEKLIRKVADLIVSEGYKEVGYEYVIIDDCWMSKKRDEYGRLLPDTDRFPSGMKSLSDYIHSRGLKFGLYQDFGNLTCAGYPGLLGHLEIDATTFAQWEVDYVKIDTCYSYDDLKKIEQGYEYFGKLLNETGRRIVYSCSWPAYFENSGHVKPDYDVLKRICNLWRNYGDIDDDWKDVLNILDWFAKNQDRIVPYAGPGHWNDPDMLLLGNYGLSYEQSKSQISLWAILSAPLLMSASLDDVRPEIKEILLNKEIIKINQDPLGIQGKLIKSINKVDVWIKPINPIVNNSTSYAVAFLNKNNGGHPSKVTIDKNEFYINDKQYFIILNVYDSSQIGYLTKSERVVTVFTKPSGVVLLKLIPLKDEDLLNLDDYIGKNPVFN